MSMESFGFNIFLSTKVSHIPNDIFKFSSDQMDKTLCLIGSGGKDFWKKLPHPLTLETHPIDQYSIECMNSFSDSPVEILFPNDDYLLPLQKLSRFFNFSHPSPIGIDISKEFGLWFSFRGVFLISDEIPAQFSKSFLSPCESCNNRPCLIAHTIFEARTMCPIKKEHQYTLEQMNYHQNAQKILR